MGEDYRTNPSASGVSKKVIMSDWAEDLPFMISFGDGITKENLDEWAHPLLLVADACARFDIRISEVEIHNHGGTYERSEDHPSGTAYFAESRLVLCTPDMITALHEASHLWLEEKHTEDWALGFFALIRTYMDEDRYEGEVWRIANYYPGAMSAARRMVHDGILKDTRPFGWNSGYSVRDRSPEGRDERSEGSTVRREPDPSAEGARPNEHLTIGETKTYSDLEGVTVSQEGEG